MMHAFFDDNVNWISDIQIKMIVNLLILTSKLLVTEKTAT